MNHRKTSEQTSEILKKSKAVLTNGHFVYTSNKDGPCKPGDGNHGGGYVNKDALFPYADLITKLCGFFAEYFIEYNVEVVIAPAIGGVVLSYCTADILSMAGSKKVLSVYAEKVEKPGSALWHICFGLRKLWKKIPQLGQPSKNDFVIKRGFDKLITGKRVLVLEDVITTGGSIKKVIDAVRGCGGTVVGLGAICNRSGKSVCDVLDVPVFFPLIEIPFETWDEKDCPLCAKGVPINTDVGKGREYLARKQRG